MSALGLMGCVSQSKYDDLEAQYQQLQQQNAAMSQQIAADKTQIGRLQGAIKYTVNSDFVPLGWLEDQRAGEADHRQNGCETRANSAQQDHCERLYR